MGGCYCLPFVWMWAIAFAVNSVVRLYECVYFNLCVICCFWLICEL